MRRVRAWLWVSLLLLAAASVQASMNDMAQIITSSGIDFHLILISAGNTDEQGVCVPTPLGKTRDPDISSIDAAAEEIRKYQRDGQLIVLESTTYPGTTEEVILPRLQDGGREVGKDFYLAFSPERVDPGNPNFNTKNIPKVVGGVTPACTRMAQCLYEQTLTTVVPTRPSVSETERRSS